MGINYLQIIMKYFALCLSLAITLPCLCQGAMTYNEAYTTFCTPEILTVFNLTEAERVTLRASNSFLSLNTDAIQDIVLNSSADNVFSQISLPFILMAIMVLVSLISFIVFLCFCSCCDRANSAAEKTAKLCRGISVLFILTFVGLFIASMVFLSRVASANKSASCLSAGLTKDLLDGVVSTDFLFVGLKNLTSILTSFQTEIASVSAIANDFDAINSKNIPAQSKTALDSLSTFYKKYKDSTTFDGAGAKSRPTTVKNMTANVNDYIYAEFKMYDQAANQITQAAQTGKTYVQNNQIQTAQTSLSSIITEIDDISSQILSYYDTTESGLEYYKVSNVVSFAVNLSEGVIIILIGVSGVQLIGLMLKKGNNKGRIGVKIILAVIAFAAFILAILFFALLGLSATVGTICNVLGGVLGASNPMTELAKYNVTLDAMVSSAINQCIPANSSGDLTSFLTNGTSIFNSLQQFIDGLSVHQTLKDNLTAYGGYSPTINATVDVWKQFQASVYPDQVNAVISLAQFNKLIKCASISYQLNAKNCTDPTACKGVYDTTSFSPPSCSASSSNAKTFFLNLKAFTSDEDKLLGNMITDLQGSNPSTPLSLNAQVRTSLKAVFPSLDNIQKKLANTVNLASTFTNGFSRAVNCTFVRKELNNLESSLCFSLNKNLYYYVMLGTLQVLFLVLFSWMLCCTLRYVPKDYEPVYI